MSDDSEFYPPKEDHSHAFTWHNCFAQVEKGSRVYYFGIVGKGEERHFRVYHRRINWLDGVWKSHDMTRPDSLEFMAALKSVRLPLYFTAECESSMHINNRLVFPRDGASLDVWWDSEANPLIEALQPVLPFLSQIREALKNSFAEMDARQFDDAAL